MDCVASQPSRMRLCDKRILRVAYCTALRKTQPFGSRDTFTKYAYLMRKQNQCPIGP
jgi:hypothetical protein